MKHALWMVIGCVLPFLLIFLLPLLGLSAGVGLALAVVLIFACHLLMMLGHRGGHHPRQGEDHAHS